jgi:Tol biopolymer transport system component
MTCDEATRERHWRWYAAVLVIAVLGGGCRVGHISDPASPCESLKPTTSTIGAPAWSPNGERLIFWSKHDASGAEAPGLYILRLQGRVAERVYDGTALAPYSIEDLSWSPDGNRVLARYLNRSWVFDLRDRSWTLVPADPSRDSYSPSWSPGGDSVLYWRSRSNVESIEMGGLYVSNLRTGVVSRYLCGDSTGVWNLDPVVFAPDGRAMAFGEGVLLTSDPYPIHAVELFVVQGDVKQKRRLTFERGRVRHPRWLHGGVELAFEFASEECWSSVDPVYHTWSVRTDGTGLRRLPFDLGDPRVESGYPPAVDVSGEKVAFVGLDGSGGAAALFVMGLDGRIRRQVFP